MRPFHKKKFFFFFKLKLSEHISFTPRKNKERKTFTEKFNNKNHETFIKIPFRSRYEKKGCRGNRLRHVSVFAIERQYFVCPLFVSIHSFNYGNSLHGSARHTHCLHTYFKYLRFVVTFRSLARISPTRFVRWNAGAFHHIVWNSCTHLPLRHQIVICPILHISRVCFFNDMICTVEHSLAFCKIHKPVIAVCVVIGTHRWRAEPLYIYTRSMPRNCIFAVISSAFHLSLLFHAQRPEIFCSISELQTRNLCSVRRKERQWANHFIAEHCICTKREKYFAADIMIRLCRALFVRAYMYFVAVCVYIERSNDMTLCIYCAVTTVTRLLYALIEMINRNCYARTLFKTSQAS